MLFNSINHFIYRQLAVYNNPSLDFFFVCFALNKDWLTKYNNNQDINLI